MSGRRLTLCRAGKKIGGVCAGLARFLDVDPTLVRIVWLALALTPPGAGAIAYVAAWLIMPNEETAAPPAASTGSSQPVYS
ncbi:MAG: PspC domain-containing protein [Acidobacteria bacterium]|nr:PspC domain-containing protein [Acidobacteriota bacterium]MBI3470373.1 PspC domain-containing protein [Candidatus Solibacter usitatus]